jgi:hypothetical protein
MLSSSSVYLALRRPPLQREDCEGRRAKLVFGFKAGVSMFPLSLCESLCV